MGKGKVIVNTAKSVGGMIGATVIVDKVVTPIIDLGVKAGIDKINDIKNTESIKNTIPKLYGKNFYMSLDLGIKKLNEKEFDYSLFEVKPNIKYKDCKPQQIILTEPKQNTKHVPGSVVCIHYVTDTVIEQSCILYENHQKEKEQIKINNNLKSTELKENTHKAIRDTLSKIPRKKKVIMDIVDANDIDIID